MDYTAFLKAFQSFVPDYQKISLTNNSKTMFEVYGLFVWIVCREGTRCVVIFPTKTGFSSIRRMGMHSGLN